MKKAILMIALSCVLSGCVMDTKLARSKYNAYVDNVPDLDPADVKSFTTNNDKILADFATSAGVKLPEANGEWRPVIDAGINYLNTRCGKFMDSLFWLNRMRETASRQVRYTGAATEAMLGVVNASKQALALTPLGFSFLDQSINNISSGLLYELNPSTVQQLVQKRQKAFVGSMTPSYTNKAIALHVIQDYATICLPSSIESEVERAIDAKEYTRDRVYPDLPPAFDDKTPDDFAFTPVADAEGGTVVTSDPIVVTGIGGPAPIAIKQGEYQIGSTGQWVKVSGLIAPRQEVRVRVTAPATAGGSTTASLTIGGVSGDFKVTTKAAAPVSTEEKDIKPPAPVAAEATEPKPPRVDSTPLATSAERNGLPDPR